MTTWKYLKGSENDFSGAHAGATHKYVHKELGHPVYTANPEIIKEVLFNLVAVRKLITECTLQDGVVFGAPIGMPLNEFKCRQQSLNASDSDIRINGIPIGEFSAKADVEVVKYDPTKVDIESLVAERGNRYGKFVDGAKIMRALKGVMHNTDGWSQLTDSQREALDMIQHKIGRILNGDPAYDDNWKDIAGYSKLIADELNGDVK